MTPQMRKALKADLMAQPEPCNRPMTVTLPIPPSVNDIYYTGDDKQSLLRDMEVDIDRERPRVELTIWQKEVEGV